MISYHDALAHARRQLRDDLAGALDAARPTFDLPRADFHALAREVLDAAVPLPGGGMLPLSGRLERLPCEALADWLARRLGVALDPATVPPPLCDYRHRAAARRKRTATRRRAAGLGERVGRAKRWNDTARTAEAERVGRAALTLLAKLDERLMVYAGQWADRYDGSTAVAAVRVALAAVFPADFAVDAEAELRAGELRAWRASLAVVTADDRAAMERLASRYGFHIADEPEPAEAMIAGVMMPVAELDVLRARRAKRRQKRNHGGNPHAAHTVTTAANGSSSGSGSERVSLAMAC